MAEVVSTGVSHMCDNSTVSVKFGETTTLPAHAHYALNIGRFLIWRFSANSPNRQIKNLTKVSRYTVCLIQGYSCICVLEI